MPAFMMPKRVAETPADKAITETHRLRAVQIRDRRIPARREGGL